jgi:site-specific recombinase
MRWLTSLRERWRTLVQPPSLDLLLARPDPAAALAERIEWAEDLLAWLRQDQPDTRLRLVFQVLERQPETRLRIARTLRSLLRDTQALDLFAETGLPRASGFLLELLHRLGSRLLPSSPATRDLDEIFDRLFPHPGDADWLEGLDDEALRQLFELWHHGETPDDTGWNTLRADLEDALVQLATRIRVTGSGPAIRARLSRNGFRELPFQKLGIALDHQLHLHRTAAAEADQAAGLNHLRALIDAGGAALDEVSAHLEQVGVSTALVYDLERLRAQLRRLELLLEPWADPTVTPRRMLAVLAELVRDDHARRSVRELCRQNLHLLTRRLVERNAETGEHYIARSRAEWSAMFRSALGGGAVLSVTTLVKFGITARMLPAFIEGVQAGLNYAISFAGLQLAGFSIATKQPATTAPALASKMHELRDPSRVESLVDEILALVRSQAAAVAGNLLAVTPGVLLLDALWRALTGNHALTAEKSKAVLESVSPLGGAWVFAAFTGVLLWTSSLIAAAAGNWFALRQLRPAISGHRNLRTVLGAARTARLALWLERNITSLTGNVSLGFLLGMAPAIGHFVGLPLDVRHVTLSTGQVAAALASSGLAAVSGWTLLITVIGLLGIGALNLAVSFGLALRVAIRARDLRGPEQRVIYFAILRRVLRQPWSLFIPGKGSPSDAGAH